MMAQTRFQATWLGVLLTAAPVFAQPGSVESQTKFIRTITEFPDPPSGDVGSFGGALTSLGDLDGPGPAAVAIAIGAHRDDPPVPGSEPGNVFIAFLDTSGQLMTVPPPTQIQNPQGGSDAARFGIAVDALGDLNGDGVCDLAIGALATTEGIVNAGAVFIYFMSPDGSPQDDPKNPGHPHFHKIDASAGGDMEGLLEFDDVFGSSVATLGVIEGGPCGDLTALAVGEHNDDDAGLNHGAVWILFLNADGSVACRQRIAEGVGGFPAGQLDDQDRFGFALASLGDLDGDGVPDLAVGVPYDDHETGNPDIDIGAVWILLLNSDGTVKTAIEYAPPQLVGPTFFEFGNAVVALGDLDGDGPGVATLAVGTPGRNSNVNSIWMLNLDDTGGILDELKIAQGQSGLEGDLSGAGIGVSLAALGDLDGDGIMDMAAGAPGDPAGDPDDNVKGAVYVLFLNGAVNFDPPIAFPAAGAASIHDTGDLDGVLGVDVVAALPDQNAIQVFLNLGTDQNGTWLGLDPQLPVIDVGADPSGVVIAQLNNDDTFLDIAVSNQGDDTVSLLKNNGDGTFQALPPLTAPEVPDEPSSIAAADFDQTGGVDLVVTSLSLDEAVVLINDGNAVFAQGAIIPVGDAPVAIVPSDLDEDKDVDADVTTANRVSDDISVAFNLGDGEFQNAMSLSVGVMPVDLAAADFNDDGVTDLASADNGSASVSVVLGQGGGGFDASSPVPVGDHPISVDAADLDGDLDGNALPDLIVVAEDSELGLVVQVLENQGSPVAGFAGVPPVFGTPLAIDVQADPNFVLHADFDDNGFDDLVTVDANETTTGSVTVILNDPVCPGDIDLNEIVDINDVLDLLAQWGPNVGHLADIDGDGVVGVLDFLAVLAAWGPCA
jgi:hypothetical protein